MDIWRIKKVPYDQFGNTQYARTYGWGWLSPIGALTIIVGVVGLVIRTRIDEDWFAGLIFCGFVLVWIGIFLNGVSERKSMEVIDATCLDVEINHIGDNMKRSADWAVRVLVEYQYGGHVYQSTPMPVGYAIFFSEDSAIRFSQYLQLEKTIKLYIDPKCPKRSLFYDIQSFQKSN